ncbi:WAX2 C-terminal domain [Musa troglodytarum]|uniref:aldehyde oxygenase (deformylating) n=1 Tax=Musa troglodytarum TaxID=320322 RepID=A0A9E7JED0_9LILI|nr:WAX2 C-terminal domain [Musa troglodytarum]
MVWTSSHVCPPPLSINEQHCRSEALSTASVIKRTRDEGEGVVGWLPGQASLLNGHGKGWATSRLAHAQLWINLARFKTIRSKHLIVDKAIEFDQEFLFLCLSSITGCTELCTVTTCMLVITPITMPLLSPSRYHAIVIHPFVEELSYFLLFALPFFCLAYTRSACIIAAVGYLTYVDFMNYMGHCNFELVPLWMFEAFPLLKYLMYTPSYHSLHHTQFRTSCCLFMPFHDYIYGTVDMSTEKLYKNSLKGKEETPDVVDLTHLTTLQSIYHLRIGLSSLASKPFVPRVHLLLAWPLSYAVLLLTCISASASTLERHRLKKLKVIAVPREEFVALKLCVATNVAAHLVLSDDYTPKVWLVGEGLTDQDQRKASSGTCFIPFSQFPVKKAHEDCTYQMTPAMAVPRTLEIMHTCEVKQIFHP